MWNSAELRCFPSSHPSLFSGFFEVKWEEGMRGRPYIGGMTRSPVGGGDRTPLSPTGGATGPPGGPTGLSPLGRATGACRPLGGDRPPLFFSTGTSLQIWRKKNYIWALSPPHRATGVYFWNFPKPTYIFEILIFFKYKKEKTASAWATM